MDARQTIIAAILVLYFCKYLTKQIRLLREYNIPDAFSGGLTASLLLGLGHALLNTQVDFQLAIRDVPLVVFFTTIGLSAKLNMLPKGDKPLLVLLSIAITYLFLQNIVGITIAKSAGNDLPTGVLAGSISLSGGHGTAIA